IVEICPVIFVDMTIKSIKGIKDYVFEIDKEKGIFGVPGGYAMFYGHNQKNNIDYAYNRSNKQLYFLTNRTINIGEELTINYGNEYWQERMNMNLMGQVNPSSNNTIAPITRQENESLVQPQMGDEPISNQN